MSEIHLEILDKKRQQVFQKLARFRHFGYLAGGTALALQIGHRKSVDFDVFVRRAIRPSLKHLVQSVFGKQSFYVNTGDQISFTTVEGIGITFVWYYYPLLYPQIKTDSIGLATVLDIAADKAETIGRRAVWRDYVDFFFLLKKKLTTIDQIIALATKKFEGEFIETQFLQQLTYYADLEVMPIEYIGESYTPEEIKSLLEEAVKGNLKKILP